MGGTLSANRYVIPIKGNCSEKAMRVWKISFVLIEQFIDVSTSDKCKFNYPYYLSERLQTAESEFDSSFQAYNKDQ
jgi:hypothetical protein